MVKWSTVQPYFEKESLDEVIIETIKKSSPDYLSKHRPISITIVKTKRGDAVRIMYRAELPEDASEYPINRIVHRYAYVFKDEDPTLYKAISKVLKKAIKEEGL